MEDGADAQEEAPEDGPQLGDQVKLHHFTQVGVVAGGMGLELEKKGQDVNKDIPGTVRVSAVNQTITEELFFFFPSRCAKVKK